MNWPRPPRVESVGHTAQVRRTGGWPPERRPCHVVGQWLLPIGRRQRESPPGGDGRQLHVGDQRLPFRRLGAEVDAVVAQYARQFVVPGGAAGGREADPLQADERVERCALGAGEVGGLFRSQEHAELFSYDEQRVESAPVWACGRA